LYCLASTEYKGRYKNTALQVYQEIMLKNEENTAAHCKYEGWNFNSGNYLFTTDTR